MKSEAKWRRLIEDKIANASPDEADAACQAYGMWFFETQGLVYNADDHLWGDAPHEGELCPGCYEWRRYPPNQRHFGWAWWRTCKLGCEHPHHASEIWLASGAAV